MRHLSPLFAFAFVTLAGGCGDLMMSGRSAPQGEAASAKTGPFDGVYVLDQDASFGKAAAADNEFGRITQMMFSPLTVRGDTIRYGRLIAGEFALLEPTMEGDVLKSDALWHEDVGDPGDMSEVRVELRREGDRLHFTYYEPGDDEEFRPRLVYRRSRS